MSSKRKNTKPTRLSEEPEENEQEPDSLTFNNTLFPIQDALTLEANSCSTNPSTINANDLQTICDTANNCANEMEQESWKLSISLPSHARSLPTMVNPANYKWSNSTFSNKNNGINGNNLDVLTNGEDHDPLLSGSTSACPPPNKSRKIRYKYQENSQVEVKYKCEICQYCTNRSDHYKRHLIIHSDVKPLKCLTCGYGTGRSDHFRRHLSRHGLSKDEITNQCQLNGIRSAQSPRRFNPRSLNHSLDEGDAVAFQLKCTTNDGPVPTLSLDVDAASSLATAKRYNCDLCAYSTDRNSHYARHVKIHSDLRPYQCDGCGKSFKVDTYLKKHRCHAKAKSPTTSHNTSIDSLIGALTSESESNNLLSTSGTPQMCIVCGAAFENLSDMSSHICSNLLGNL